MTELNLETKDYYTVMQLRYICFYENVAFNYI